MLPVSWDGGAVPGLLRLHRHFMTVGCPLLHNDVEVRTRIIYSGNFQIIVGLLSHSTLCSYCASLQLPPPRSACSLFALLNLHELCVPSNFRSVILDSFLFLLNTVGDVFEYLR